MARSKQQIVREILGNFPHWVKKEENSLHFKILSSFASELATHSTEQDNMRLEVFIETATGESLDSLAKIFKLSRREAETDTDFRARIKAFWPGFSGGGTAPSIKSAIAKVTGVLENDITINEQFTVTEKHFFESGKEKYILNNQRALDNATLQVSGTAGASPYTFIKGTDFDLVQSEIRFGIGGTDPDPSTIFSVDYDYVDQLRFLLDVAISPTASATQTLIRDLVPDIKAAGTEPILSWTVQGGVLNESVSVADSIEIISTSTNFFIIDVSLIDSGAVLQ